MQDANYRIQVEKFDANFGKTMETENIKEAKEEIKRIWLEKIRLEQELTKSFEGKSAPNPQIAQNIAMVERTKIYDSLYLKYGLKLNYLMKAYDFHDLANDPDIKDTEVSYKMQLDKKMKDQIHLIYLV